MTETCDALVIGSGIAGLSYALEASKDESLKIIVVTKRSAEVASSSYAQGGIAAVMSPLDSVEAHTNDTLTAGAGLCRYDVVKSIIEDGPEAIKTLIDYGIQFDESEAEDAPTEYDLTREGGHSKRRILHAGDITGQEIMRGMIAALSERPNVDVRERHCAVDLLTTRKVAGLQVGVNHRPPSGKNRCLGAYVLDEAASEVRTILGKVTVVATGGASKVYLYTSNPDVATGDGIAMGWRAGARVANMEFIQFHPTCLFNPKAKSFLISEALRGEGGILKRKDGTRFMENYHPLKELAPRDIVARAIDTELKRTGDEYVVLDMTHEDAEFLKKRFPNIYAECMKYGIDLTKEPIPVVPAAHYVCGGIVTDTKGETDISALFVVGEASCTGLHGANRLASNSLLEGAVMGRRAAEASKTYWAEATLDLSEVPEWDPGAAVPSDELVVISQCWDEIRRFMWNYVGIVRSNRRLQRARRRIDTIKEEIRDFYWNATVTRDLLELRNICTVAELIVKCAMERRESRGLHYTIDYPRLSMNASDTLLEREDLI